MVRLDVTAGSEIEPVYAGPQMRAIGFQAIDREHAHAALARLSRDAGQVPNVSTCRAWNRKT